MRSLPLMVSGWLAAACLVMAQDFDREPVETLPRLETVQGRAFEEVRVMKVTENELRIVHKEGAASVRLADLSPEMQSRFRYDPEAGAAADAKAAEIRAAQVAAAHAEDAKGVAAKDERAAKRAAALKYLKDRKYGGRSYWIASTMRTREDGWAKAKLKEAGFSKEESDKILADMREAGKREPAPADMDPAFRPRANTEDLRGGTEGAQGKPKIKKLPF